MASRSASLAYAVISSGIGRSSRQRRGSRTVRSLAVGLINPVNVVGAMCLAFLIALLLLEQSFTELSQRAALQLPVRLLEVVLVLTLRRGIYSELFVAATAPRGGCMVRPRMRRHTADRYPRSDNADARRLTGHGADGW